MLELANLTDLKDDMESLEGFNIELKRAGEYLDAMAKGTANKEDCENVKMHLDNINSIVRNLSIPDVVNTSKFYHENHEWKSDGDGGNLKYCNDCKGYV